MIASRYEGLGLPALEAWALGTPAVVADSGAAREVLRGLPGGGSLEGTWGGQKAVTLGTETAKRQ